MGDAGLGPSFYWRLTRSVEHSSYFEMWFYPEIDKDRLTSRKRMKYVLSMNEKSVVRDVVLQSQSVSDVQKCPHMWAVWLPRDQVLSAASGILEVSFKVVSLENVQ